MSAVIRTMPANRETLGAVESVARAITVFYHAGCSDGIAGAWAIYRGLHYAVRADIASRNAHFEMSAENQLRDVGAVFMGIQHDSVLASAELARDRHVFYVDISPATIDAAKVVLQIAASVTILDHHRSAKKVIEHLNGCGLKTPFAAVYDEARSGAHIAWDYMFPGEPRPSVLDYIGDRDIWAWSLPLSQEVNLAIHTDRCARDFASLDKVAATGGFVLSDFAQAGKAYARYRDGLIEQCVARAREAIVRARLPGDTEVREYRVLAVNSAQLASEVGDALMTYANPHIQFAVIWKYSSEHDEIWVSARTKKDRNIDLSAITPHIEGAMRGGGHPMAAGFTIPGDSPSRAIIRIR